jgi:multidrug efflux pump subunit AcrB
MLAAQLSRFRGGQVAGSRLLAVLPRAVAALEGSYRRLLPRLLRRRWLVVVGALAACAASLALASRLGSEFLPPVDDGRVSVWVTMPPETPAEVTDLACRASEQAVLGLPK